MIHPAGIDLNHPSTVGLLGLGYGRHGDLPLLWQDYDEQYILLETLSVINVVFSLFCLLANRNYRADVFFNGAYRYLGGPDLILPTLV